MSFKILVCGGRDYEDEKKVFTTLGAYLRKYGDDLEIISGMARGADTFGSTYARLQGLVLHEFPALWDTEGRAAGPLRNIRMLENGKPDLILAFGGGTGTNHMVSIAKKAGVEVKEYDR